MFDLYPRPSAAISIATSTRVRPSDVTVLQSSNVAFCELRVYCDFKICRVSCSPNEGETNRPLQSTRYRLAS